MKFCPQSLKSYTGSSYLVATSTVGCKSAVIACFEQTTMMIRFSNSTFFFLIVQITLAHQFRLASSAKQAAMETLQVVPDVIDVAPPATMTVCTCFYTR